VPKKNPKITELEQNHAGAKIGAKLGRIEIGAC
jgi:hypothetical protein